MADESEEGADDRLPWTEGLRQRMPEAGVGFFGTFILALVIGFLLVMAGQHMLAVIVFGVAIVSILATLLTPSPAAKERRAASGAPPEDGEEEGEEEEVETRPDLGVDEAPAPTSGRRPPPAPPPEPPPMEDVVVDLGDEGGAPAGEDDEDVWVE